MTLTVPQGTNGTHSPGPGTIRRPRSEAVDGVLLIDKPEGITSYAVVDKVKRLLRIKKVGHCGTLDPFATGVLVICLGQATRIVDQLLTQDKVYAFTAYLGVETDTQDKTGKVIATCPHCRPQRDRIESVLTTFLGRSVQQVPRFSAVKVEGKRLYRLAREGIEVDLPTRSILVDRLQLMDYRWPELHMEVACSKGTYVRQLATDIGSKLGCGAHVSVLRRVASGSFTVDRAITLETLEELHHLGTVHEAVISMSRALDHLPFIEVNDRDTQQRLKNGQMSHDWSSANEERFTDERTPVRLLTGKGALLGLWWPNSREKGARHLRIFHTE